MIYEKLFPQELINMHLNSYSEEDQSVGKAIRKKVLSNLVVHLKDMDKSALEPIETHGYKIAFINSWNKWIKGEELEDWYQRNFYKALMNYFSFKVPMAGEENLKEDDLALENQQCAYTGISVTLFPQENNFIAKEYHLDTNVENKIEIDESLRETDKKKYSEQMLAMVKQWKKEFRDLTPCPFENKIYTSKINFPTGKIMINDWFRDNDGKFSEAVDNSEAEYCINYSAGIIESIRHFSENENFVSVNVGNSCPSIYLFDDLIVVGEYCEAADDYRVGGVCTDLWNATLIDEDTYRSKLGKVGVGSDKVEELLKYQREYHTTVNIEIEPGEWELSYFSYQGEFAENYSGEIPHDIKAYFVLKKV